MRPSPGRAPNPDYKDPREYLRAGFFTPDGKAVRPELLAERAAAMGRELLIRAVPLELVGAIARSLDLLAKADKPFEERRAWLLARGLDSSLRRHPTLVRLLQAGAGAVRRPADLGAFATHLKRVHQLAAFERVLGRAIALEQAAAEARAARAGGVRAYKRRRGQPPY